MEYLSAPLEIADVRGLEECIRQLRRHWLSARSMGSLFEAVLGERLEELLLLHSQTHAKALRRHDHWDIAYRHAAARQVFRRRKEKYAVTTPLKRRLIVKLLALRALTRGSACNERKRPFDLALAQRYSGLLREYDAVKEKLRAREMEKAKKKKRRRRKMDKNGDYELLDGGPDDDDDDVEEGGGENVLSEAEERLLELFESPYPSDPAALPAGEAEGLRSHESGLEDAAADSSLPSHSNGLAMGRDRFSPQELAEAAEMLSMLKVRTEASLTKHHIASVNLKQWSNAAAEEDHVASSLSAPLTAHDSDRFTSFRGIYCTVP